MSWTHLETTTPRARKRHYCRVCGEAIEPGELHIARKGAEDGRIVIDRFHNVCRWYSWGWDEIDWETVEAGSVTRQEVRRAFSREIGSEE